MRVVQAGVKSALGRGLVVENLLGAGGCLGAAKVKKAEPDGCAVGARPISDAALLPLHRSRAAARFGLALEDEVAALVAAGEQEPEHDDGAEAEQGCAHDDSSPTNAADPARFRAR